MEYAACDFAFGKALCISLLLVLCKFFAFLVSCLLVLCKFLAKFLAKSLQEFGAGSGKRGKVDPTMAPKSIQNGANLAQGVGKGYPEINRNMKNGKKRKRKHKNEKNERFVLYVRRFPQKTEGSTGGRLLVFSMLSMLYKTVEKMQTQK